MRQGQPKPTPTQETRELLEQLDAELVGLIEKYYTIPAISLSSYKGTRTGNRYQSLNLRDRTLKGFRDPDKEIYTGLPLKNVSIVDLGCNTGEKTRYASDLGASFAEGIEYEELFVRIGNLVSAYNQYGNVVLRQGDLTTPGLLKRRYDVAASFSSFVYLKDTLSEILSHVNRMFICETHALTKRWLPRYVKPVEDHFPYWLLYGFSDHGGSHKDGRRALLLFAKNSRALSQTIFGRASLLPPQNESVRQIDVNSSIRAATLIGNAPSVRQVVVDARERFASAPIGNIDAIITILVSTADNMERAGASQAPDRFASDSYWHALFRGVAAYRSSGAVTPDNPFLQMLRRIAKSGGLDMENTLLDDVLGPKRVASRLNGFIDALSNRRNRDHLVAFNPAPEGMVDSSAKLNPNQKITTVDGQTYVYHSFDGYHRLSAAWLCKVPTCTVYFCWTNMFGLATRNYASLAKADDKDAAVEALIDSAVMHQTTLAQKGRQVEIVT